MEAAARTQSWDPRIALRKLRVTTDIVKPRPSADGMLHVASHIVIGVDRTQNVFRRWSSWLTAHCSTTSGTSSSLARRRCAARSLRRVWASTWSAGTGSSTPKVAALHQTPVAEGHPDRGLPGRPGSSLFTQSRTHRRSARRALPRGGTSQSACTA